MIVQWHRDDETAAIFDNGGVLSITTLLECDATAVADVRLRALGWRRRQAWQETAWGYEAWIRRMPLRGAK